MAAAAWYFLCRGAAHFETMLTLRELTEKTLTELGIRDALSVEDVFAKVRESFDKQIATRADDVRNLMLREAWLGSETNPATSFRSIKFLTSSALVAICLSKLSRTF